ncbi:galactose-specific lectin nattectin isoform X1 [Etheostoma spectabile]|uniref:galactose-specific lectin nattectin isoform X1 n=2 Tax=Etheostoma spectabile TaxID=54343 RepID=UPI0013AF0520|nr:galactose-specific lectin nattectin-like isoform X1 [Etheostoma spectabile]
MPRRYDKLYKDSSFSVSHQLVLLLGFSRHHSAKMTSVFLISVCLCLSSGLLAAYGAPPCPPDWTQFGSRCFSYNIQPKTWIDAETFCQTAGGNLASIHSAEEHKFIRDYINQVSITNSHSWIGGFDAVREGTWLWSDGSKFDFTYFNAGDPNGGAWENCLLIYYGVSGWYDGACGASVSFMCSKDSVEP